MLSDIEVKGIVSSVFFLASKLDGNLAAAVPAPTGLVVSVTKQRATKSHGAPPAMFIRCFHVYQVVQQVNKQAISTQIHTKARSSILPPNGKMCRNKQSPEEGEFDLGYGTSDEKAGKRMKE